MKSKKLTKEQILELENEACGLLQGQSHYTKKTAAELTSVLLRKKSLTNQNYSKCVTHEPGQILRLADAYAVFRDLLRARELPDIKRSDFKAVVGPMITSQFNVCLRNDLDGAGVRGWKGVRLQSLPGQN